ncbi:MAG: hypothetical protein DRI61_09550, partial [Chloroflexi bacterium]
YNGTGYIEARNYAEVGETNLSVSVLENRSSVNEGGNCSLVVENRGGATLNITQASFLGYLATKVEAIGIIPSIGGFETYSLDPNDDLLNVSVKVFNSNSTSISGTLWINITNTTDTLNSSSHSFSVNPGEIITYASENIDTSGWAFGNYNITATLIYSGIRHERTETITKQPLNYSEYHINYTCPSTNETIYLTLRNRFLDTVEYNVTLEVPSGWSFTNQYEAFNLTPGESRKVQFNVTSSSSTENVTLNVSINYTLPHKQASQKVAAPFVNDYQPILEILRETPKIISPTKVFESALVIHNKGCAPASGAHISEQVKPGWTPANPSLEGDVELISSNADLEFNRIEIELGEIAVDKYTILNYQVKAPPGTDEVGTAHWNITFDGRFLEEPEEYKMYTASYTGESHFEFDAISNQYPEFPWPETRSMQQNEEYNITLIARNIGDTTAYNWTIRAFIPEGCNITHAFQNGTINGKTITWNLTGLGSRQISYFNFTLNCSETGDKSFTVNATRDTRGFVSYSDNMTQGCSGESCIYEFPKVFSNPSEPYQRITTINVSFHQNSTTQNATISEFMISIKDDEGRYHTIWQNHSFSFTDSNQQTTYYSGSLRFSDTSRYIKLFAHTDGEKNKLANLTLKQMNYSWEYGKEFKESQKLYLNSKVYYYTPMLENATLYINGNSSATVGGWGEKFNFSVMVKDRFGRNVTLYAWHRSGLNWLLINSTLVESVSDWRKINFSYDYQPDDMGGWEFKFNATNADGDSELYGHTYTVEEDDINLLNITPGWNETVNRSAPYNFTFRVNDTDNNSWAVLLQDQEAYIEISKFGSNETYQFFFTNPVIDSQGYSKLLMEPTPTKWCQSFFTLGQKYWRGGVQYATYYKDAYLQPPPDNALPFMLYGQLNNTMHKPNKTANYTKDQSVVLEGTINDDCDTSITDATVYFKLEHNGYVENVRVFYSDSRGTYYDEHTMDTSAPLGWYNVTMISNKTYYWNGTKFLENAFFLASVPHLDGVNVNPSSDGWGKSPFNFSVNITDSDNDTVTIYFWLQHPDGSWELNSTDSCTGCDNTEIKFQRNFSVADVGDWNFTINATDTAGFSNTTAPIPFTVEKDDLLLQEVVGNNTEVNRSSGSVILGLRAYDSDLAQYTVDINTTTKFFTYVYNGTEWRKENETTNATHFYLDFNPDCNYSAGQRYWKMNVTNSSSYKDVESEHFWIKILGDLSASIVSPVYTNYTQGDPLTIVGNVTDDCGQNVTGATVQFRLDGAGGPFYCPSSGWADDEGNGRYNCTIATDNMGGWYNLTMTVNKSGYWSDSKKIENNIYVRVAPKLYNIQVSPEADGWSLTRTFLVNVTDQGDNDTLMLWQRHSTLQPDWEYLGTRYCYDCSNTTVNWTATYSCSDVSEVQWEFKINVTDTEGTNYTSQP